jgi:hypothetical protein
MVFFSAMIKYPPLLHRLRLHCLMLQQPNEHSLPAEADS